MSYFFEETNGVSPWKQQQGGVDTADFANNEEYIIKDVIDNTASSFNYTVAIDSSFDGEEKNLTCPINSHEETNDSFHGDFGDVPAGSVENTFFGSHHGMDGPSNEAMDPGQIEEESQVVPASLDHLSRDQLCRMIYRLDYERNQLQNKLKAMKGALNFARKGEARGRKRARPPFNDQMRGSITTIRQVDGTGKEEAAPRLAMPIPPPPPPHEIERFRKQLAESVHAAVRSAVHGGRRIPKSIVAEGDVPVQYAAALMQGHDGRAVSDTKRMTKWNFVEDGEIARLLQCERLIHPVMHDGTGHIIPVGSSHKNVYNWARFVSMEVRYDKREATMTLTVKTTAAGCGRPENVPEKLKYSQGERVGLLGKEFEGSPAPWFVSKED